MIEYQNIFTQVQVQVSLNGAWTITASMAEERIGKPFFSTLLGWLGNAQLGPIYLGWTRVLSAWRQGSCGFNIVGLNMLAQVNWSISEFIRQLFWLALEPPSPEYGLTIPPLN